MIYIFLDNDGVVNSLSKKPPKQNTGWLGAWSRVFVESSRGKSWPMLWSHELIAQLELLNQRDDVQFVVLSTWRQAAKDTVFPLMGLNTEGWPVLDAENVSDSYTGGWMTKSSKWWKLTEVEDFVHDKPAEDRFVWLDDDLRYEDGAHKFASTGHDFLLVAPEQTHGLTQTHIDRILKFINN